MLKHPNILLVTVTDVESKSVLEAFKNKNAPPPEICQIDKRYYHYLGVFNGNHVYLLQSQMGSVKYGGALQTVTKGIHSLSPQMVIMVGIAFGIDPKKQKMGDVLVSSQLFLYESQRIGKKHGEKWVIARGEKPPSSALLFNAVQAIKQYWKGAEIRLGPILSGEKLVDNLNFRQELLSLAPESIGGEMEGAGLYAACQEAKTDWILIKAISDWADGNKDKNRKKNQQFAARNAAKFTFTIVNTITADEISEKSNNIITPTKRKNASNNQTNKKKPFLLNNVPFVNRTDEINLITSLSNVIHYFLVSAPIGYGKSDLLSKVFEKFDSAEWSRAYIKVTKDTSLKEITQELSKGLRAPLKPDDGVSWGMRLGSSWIKFFEKNHKNLVFMIDLDKEPSKTLLEYLINDFVVDIQSSLNTLKSFQNGKRIFRVIIAGRHLTSFNEFKDSKYFESWQPINLSPFTFDVVKLSANRYLEKRQTLETIEQIAAHTLYLTGGHPHCVAETLSHYQENGISPDAFKKNKENFLWKTVYSETINDVKSHLVSQLRLPEEVLEAISVLRFLDDVAMQSIFKNHKSRLVKYGVNDYLMLRDKLTESFYFSHEESEPWVISDAISRVLISIKLRHEKIDVYSDYCDDAIKICEERIRNEQHPYRWIVEYLFQSLQKQAANIDHMSNRLDLRDQYFRKIVPGVMELFFSTRNYKNKEIIHQKELIRKEIRNDKKHWEFRFLINYSLRENQYTDEPFKMLVTNSKL